MTSVDDNPYAAPRMDSEPGVVATKRQPAGLLFAGFVLTATLAVIAVARIFIGILGEAAMHNINIVLLVSLVLVSCIAIVAAKRYWLVPQDVCAVLAVALLSAIAVLIVLILNDVGAITLF